MKRTIILFAALLLLIPIFAQEKYAITNDSIDSDCKNLVLQLNVMMIYGQDYAKLHGMTAAEYGQYVGEQFIKQGMTKQGNIEVLTDACLYNLTYLLSSSEIEVLYRTPQMVQIKAGLLHGFHKSKEPCYLITADDYHDYITAAFKTIAKNGGCSYISYTLGETVYITISSN